MAVISVFFFKIEDFFSENVFLYLKLKTWISAAEALLLVLICYVTMCTCLCKNWGQMRVLNIPGGPGHAELNLEP